ncbi:MAG TPA: DUF3108 domain-containing protein [Rhodanobacteraceae bacterium]|nr:DUF3108 domain-containing protein [Rhodanobacteraceae bacterium]
MKTIRSLFMAGALLLSAGAALASPLPAFTARYQLLKDGSPIGEATMTLQSSGDDTWTFTTASRGTQGLAALISANIQETSTFRWKGSLPEGLSYDYAMDAAIKHKERHVRFDWTGNTIVVDDKGEHRFAAQPGALERHTTVLAIAAGLRDGKRKFDLPVAVRDRIETQHYAAQGKQQVQVPAGDFDAIHVVRTNGGGFEAWFTPKFPVPLQVAQDDGGELMMKLESYEKRVARD